MGVKINLIEGSITSPKGFVATGIKAGIKTSGVEDLAVLFSDKKCSAAGTFTKNKIRAASVDWCKKLLPSGSIQAVICTSGCANACTGKRGKEDNENVALLVAKALNIKLSSVLVASTGVIGHFLPMERISDAICNVKEKLSINGGTSFATAIMTTDTRKKEIAVVISQGKNEYTIGGCIKGSGMICPNMATMLGFITTDAMIDYKILNKIVKKVVDLTFNNLTIDGDTSTNDMVLVLANGESGISLTKESDLITFEKALYEVCNELCKQIAADGEGATKRIEIRVKDALNEKEAKAAAKAVANSNLVKCAMFGNDPNWGRIACAIGYSGVRFSEKTISISICGVPVFKGLQPVSFDTHIVHQELKQKIVTIDINLGVGKASAIAHTCDFSYDYVKINAEYHT